MDWTMIEHICISVAVVGAALTYIIKGIRFAKKPADDVNKKLDSDNKRLVKLEEESEYISKSIGILMKSNLAILGHLQTGNNSGKMSEMEREIQDFLITN